MRAVFLVSVKILLALCNDANKSQVRMLSLT